MKIAHFPGSVALTRRRQAAGYADGLYLNFGSS